MSEIKNDKKFCNLIIINDNNGDNDNGNDKKLKRASGCDNCFKKIVGNDSSDSGVVVNDLNISKNCCSTSSSSDNNIMKPGSKIKPEISINDVKNLIEKLYNLKNIDEIKELNSYDDRNFFIRVNRNNINSSTSSATATIETVKTVTNDNYWPNGYVFKILNSNDSKKHDFVDAQNQVMIFLRENGINCPRPIKNVHNQLYSIENLNGAEHAIRLLEFVPGKILYEVPCTNNLFYRCGEYVANLDRILKNFHHDACKTYITIWQLQSVPKLKEFLYVIDDYGHKMIVEEVIEAFEAKVLPHLNVLEKSIIHGDFNEQNIIVKKMNDNEECKDYKIDGILDFGDMNYGPVVFELAITMTYMILQAKDLSCGGLVMAGYSTVRQIPSIEKEILKECVAARLCQSLILGLYSHSLNPNNDYLLITQKSGWELLESLWKDNLDKVDELWKNIADYYLMQSMK